MVALAIAALVTSGWSAGEGGAAYQRAEKQCAAAARSFGPVALPPGERGLKKLKHVDPAFPSSSGKHGGTGDWRGVVLVGPDGKVKGLWSFAEPEFQPAWPEGVSAITDAIRRWEYSPALMNGEPQPVCLTVVAEIHWRTE